MSSKSDNKEVNGEIESKSKRKIAELEASLKEKTKLEEKYLNQLKYARADLENLHKHIQRCINEGVIREKTKLITQLLTIAEEVDLALDETKKSKNSNLQEGIEMVRKKLWNVISCEGLCPIVSIGKPFDPTIHEAIQKVETCNYPEGMVVQEIKRGYLLNGKVFRPSLVKVACSSRPDKVENCDEK